MRCEDLAHFYPTVFKASTISVTEDNSQLAGLPDRPFVIRASARATGLRPVWERIKLRYTDERELLLASLHVLGIISGLAWRREIARRRIAVWARAFLSTPSSRKLKQIEPDSGFSFRGSSPYRVTSDQEGLSTLIVLENDTPLAAAHTPHDEIRLLGRGRYSHWGRYMYFSSSDNTDPRKNGRIYKLVRRM